MRDRTRPHRPSICRTSPTDGTGTPSHSACAKAAASRNAACFDAPGLYSFIAASPHSKTSASLPDPISRPREAMALAGARRLVRLDGAHDVVVRRRLVELPQEAQLDERLGIEIDPQVD